MPVEAQASLTLLAGAAGIALNSGIVGASRDGNVGQISPVNTTANPPITVYVDEPATTAPVTAAPIGRTHQLPTGHDLGGQRLPERRRVRRRRVRGRRPVRGRRSQGTTVATSTPPTTGNDGGHEYEGADDDD